MPLFNKNSLITYLCLLSALTLRAQCLSTDEAQAKIWLDNFNEQHRILLVEYAQAGWNFQVSLSGDTEQRMLDAEVKYNQFLRNKRLEMDQLFDWRRFENATLTRMFDRAADIGLSAAKDVSKLSKLSSLINNMSRIYSMATVLDPISNKLIPYSPNITGMMGAIAVPEEVKRQLWSRWRDATGKRIRRMYESYVELSNDLIKDAGFENYAQYWQSQYEPRDGEDFENTMYNLWLEVEPFYRELHAYVRHALQTRLYSSKIFPSTGHIPGHILGHISAGRWTDLGHVTLPHPDVPSLDVTSEMKRQNWTARRIFQVSESFYASLGLGRMTDSFWNKSIIERPHGARMVCHPSAWDFSTNNGDFRIKQCTAIDINHLIITHHEMGHVQYYMQYETLPLQFRGGANPGFHEAVGDTIELSVMTPTYLRKIGLLKSESDSDEFYTNYLYLMALKKVVNLPFGYLVDHYRYKLFKGEVPKDQWNSKWVNLRCKLMGVAAPVPRTEQDFDAGAIYHVAADIEYMRYFISNLLQFQFHQSLCKAAGFNDELHKCSIYNNTKAGDKLRAMLSKGSSVHWQDALFEISGTRKISAQPLLDYFKPLRAAIRRQNAKNNVKVGWEDHCPPDDWLN